MNKKLTWVGINNAGPVIHHRSFYTCLNGALFYGQFAGLHMCVKELWNHQQCCWFLYVETCNFGETNPQYRAPKIACQVTHVLMTSAGFALVWREHKCMWLSKQRNVFHSEAVIIFFLHSGRRPTGAKRPSAGCPECICNRPRPWRRPCVSDWGCGAVILLSRGEFGREKNKICYQRGCVWTFCYMPNL